MSIVKKVKDISADIQSVSGFGSAVCDAIAMGLYDKGYRANIKNIDEFAKRLIDAFPKANPNHRSPCLYYDEYRYVIEELAEEMKGGE